MVLDNNLYSALAVLEVTGGNTEAKNEIERVIYWNVPKRILVSCVQVLLQNRKLKVAQDLPDSSILARELQEFQVKISDGGHDSYGAWREGANDDLVLATSLACWAATHPDFIAMPIPLVFGKVRLGF